MRKKKHGHHTAKKKKKKARLFKAVQKNFQKPLSTLKLYVGEGKKSGEGGGGGNREGKASKRWAPH